MRHPSRLYLVAAVCATALQLSCGDSAGPGPVAATIEPNSSTSISSPPGAPVFERPSVIVRGADGAPLSGATVTFAITSGGGSIAGATQTTNSAGVATLGSWVLGEIPGTNTLTASVAGLQPLVFTASTIDPCDVTSPHSLGATTQGTLATGDCRFADGQFVDFYATTLSAGTYLFNMTADPVDTYLFMLTAAGAPVGVNDDLGSNDFNSRIKTILPAGNYILAATSYAPTAGTYTLASAATTAEVTNCEDVFVLRGITTNQNLQSTDCAVNGRADEYLIYLIPGQTVTASMSSSAFDSFLTILGLDGSTKATNDNREAGTTDARVTYTGSGFGDFYIIRAGSATTAGTGQYTLAIE